MKRFALILLAATGFVSQALADDLPGVNKPKQIVRPLPEPLDQTPSDQTPSDQTTSDKDAADAIRVGDWDVKVSGSVSVDIGAGATGRRQR